MLHNPDENSSKVEFTDIERWFSPQSTHAWIDGKNRFRSIYREGDVYMNEYPIIKHKSLENYLRELDFFGSPYINKHSNYLVDDKMHTYFVQSTLHPSYQDLNMSKFNPLLYDYVIYNDLMLFPKDILILKQKKIFLVYHLSFIFAFYFTSLFIIQDDSELREYEFIL